MNPMARFLPRALLLALLAAVAACSSFGPKLESPQLTLLGIQILSADMFSQQFKVRVKVVNPNDLEVAVRGLEYDILLMGDSFAEGTANQPFVLPARGEVEFDMAVTTNFVSSLGRLVSRMQGGKLEDVQYQITGKLLLEKGVMRTIPFSHAGTVDFKKARDKLKSAEPGS
jgi:LEA14-like dessication related protein